MAEELGRALEWDDEIEKDSSFTLLEPGDYNFTVVNFERGNFGGNIDRGGKIPACNMANLTIRVYDNNGNSSTWKEGFILHTILEWKISEIHRALGLKQHGERLRMKWKEMVGLTGACKVKIYTWTNKKGESVESNQVEKYYDPEDMGVTTTAPAKQGGLFAPKR